MNRDPKIKQKLEAIVHVWDEAEGFIKQAEVITGEAVIPAINELRYAGRRLVDLLQQEVTLENGVEFDTAHHVFAEVEENCIRARHDVVDAVFFHADEYFRWLEDRFSLPVLCQIYPSYAALRRKMFEVADRIIESRESRSKRAELYKDLHTSHLPEIIDAYRVLSSSDERLAQDVAAAKRRNAFNVWVPVAIGAALAIVGIYIGVAVSKNWWPF